MKTALLVICSLLITYNVFAYDKTKELSPEEQTQVKEHRKTKLEKIDSIELIEGIPQRKFVKLAPLWEKDEKIENAVKKLKKQAVKVGADAVIDFQFGSGSHGSGGAVGGVGWATSDTQPVVSGWAVKWAD